MRDTALRCLWNASCVLGESPIWHPIENVLYWVDIVGKTLHRLTPSTMQHQLWLMPTDICCIVPLKRGGLVAAMRSGIAILHPVSSDLEYVATLNNQKTMFNDGHCDVQGRFWIGTKDTAESSDCGAVFCFDGHQLIQRDNAFTVTNGLIFSLDNRYCYIADSPKRIIYRYDFDVNKGLISNKKTFARIAEDAGYPDGMTIDTQGCIWSCHYNGWRVTRYSPEGEIDRVIKMPTQAPTSCCFGGDDLKTLFITSAKRDVAIGSDQPLAGAVFSADLDVGGVLDHCFE